MMFQYVLQIQRVLRASYRHYQDNWTGEIMGLKEHLEHISWRCVVMIVLRRHEVTRKALCKSDES